MKRDIEAERTAPRLYGKLFVVCEGVEEWCGQSVEVDVEVLAGYVGDHASASCPECGRKQTVHVIETRQKGRA